VSSFNPEGRYPNLEKPLDIIGVAPNLFYPGSGVSAVIKLRIGVIADHLVGVSNVWPLTLLNREGVPVSICRADYGV
jgi:hypothetical protein